MLNKSQGKPQILGQEVREKSGEFKMEIWYEPWLLEKWNNEFSRGSSF